MRVSHVTIYCLPNIRSPWVLVFEPHPWGHGALRVREDSAVMIYQRPATVYELAFTADCVRHVCLTFATAEGLLDYEDGQHDDAAGVRQMIELRRDRVTAVLAEVERKRSDKRARERRRSIPLAGSREPDDDPEDFGESP